MKIPCRRLCFLGFSMCDYWIHGMPLFVHAFFTIPPHYIQRLYLTLAFNRFQWTALTYDLSMFLKRQPNPFSHILIRLLLIMISFLSLSYYYCLYYDFVGHELWEKEASFQVHCCEHCYWCYHCLMSPSARGLHIRINTSTDIMPHLCRFS